MDRVWMQYPRFIHEISIPTFYRSTDFGPLQGSSYLLGLRFSACFVFKFALQRGAVRDWSGKTSWYSGTVRRRMVTNLLPSSPRASAVARFKIPRTAGGGGGQPIRHGRGTQTDGRAGGRGRTDGQRVVASAQPSGSDHCLVYWKL